MVIRTDENGNAKLVTNIRRPRKWKRYEYLLSDGNAYINTGITYNSTKNTYKIECKFSLPTNIGNYDAIFGAYTSESHNTLRIIRLGSNNKFGVYYNIKAGSGGNPISITTSNANIKEIILTSSLLSITENNTTTIYPKSGNTATNTTSTFYLFCQGIANGSISCLSKSRIYYFKFYDNNVLLKHFIPALYNGEYGMWDLVEDKFYGNKGTGSFTVGPEIKNYDEIKEVRKEGAVSIEGIELYDYIESTGTLWIDTGVYGTLNTKVILEFKTPSSNSGTNVGSYFGCRDGQNNKAFLFGTGDGTNRTSTYFFTQFDSITSTIISNPTLDFNKHTLVFSKDGYYLDSTLYRTYNGASSFKTSHTLPLFGVYSIDTFLHTVKTGILTVYSLKLYENNQLVRNMFPCTYLGEPGMWDTVENKFYRNQGTGLFILGSKITLKKYEYLLGDGVSCYIDTGFYPNNNTHIKTNILIPTVGNGTIGVYGAAGSSYTDRTFELYDWNNLLLFNYGNGTNYLVYPPLNTWLEIEHNKNRVSCNGTTGAITANSFNSPTTMYLFSTHRSNATTFGNKSNIKMQYFKLWNNDTLIRDFIPISYNGTPGLWDKVEWKFYANAGTGEFTLGPEVGIYEPGKIELYDYILSSGTQWIDTGYVPNNTSGIYLKAYCTTSGENHLAIGCRQTSGDTRWWINYSTTLELSWNLWTATLTGYTNTWTEVEHNYMNSRSAKVNGIAYSVNYPTLTNITYPAYLFNSCNKGNLGTGFTGRISNVKITEGTTLVRNFIPCTYEGEPGMWDTVEAKFYKNLGTGQFTLGNKITLKKYEYLQGNGSGYLDTNVVATANTKLKFSFKEALNSSTTYYPLCCISGTGIELFTRANIDYAVWAGSEKKFNGPNTTNLVDIELTHNYCKVNGTILVSDYSTHSLTLPNVTIPIFGYRKADNSLDSRKGSHMLYYFQIYDNDILIRDFVPVSHNGIPGLWDKIEWRFYPNLGTGLFTLGKLTSVVYPVKEAYAYGVLWEENQSSPVLLRLGNAEYHRTLPILSLFKGCIFNTETKKVVYWLDEYDWSKKADGTASVLDGTDGQVMVHTPKFWGKSGRYGTKCWVKISPVYIDSTWQEIPEMFIGAYRGTVSNGKAYSVVNTTTAFRGGLNRSNYDTYLNTDPFRSDLGKPRTYLSRGEMRTYCRNNNMEMLNYELYKWIFYWCYVIEYANFNCQLTFNNSTTLDGYKQGGLGPGVTIWTGADWENYNGLLPVTPNGYCNNLGNRTGLKALTIPLTTNGGTTIESITFLIPRWRGFDNPFGDIHTSLDGCIVQGDTAGDPKSVYTTTDPSEYGDNTTIMNNMDLIGHIVDSEGYTKEFDLGSTGNIFASSVGGTASTYKCSRNYPGSKDETLRCLAVGGTVKLEGKAGLGAIFSSVLVGDKYKTIGFRPVVVI